MVSYGIASPISASVLAERALVGALIWEPNRLQDVSGWLEPEDFESLLDGRIYEVVCAMAAEQRADRLVFELPEALARGRYRSAAGPEPPHPAREWALAIHERLQATPSPPPPPPDENVPGVGTVEGITADNRKNSEHLRYAWYVLEASTRRAVADIGSQIEYIGNEAAEEDICPDTVLETLEHATSRLADLAERLAALDNPSVVRAPVYPQTRNDVGGSTLPPTRRGLPERAPRLTSKQLRRAELETLAGAITLPSLRTALVGRLVPADFSDRAIGATWAAVEALHRQDQPVDYVTVAWQAERATRSQGAPIPMEQLANMGAAGPRSAQAYEGSELVARAAMLRYTAQAGRDTQDVVQADNHVRDLAATASDIVAVAQDDVRRLHPSAANRPASVEGNTVPSPRRPAGTPPGRSPHVTPGRTDPAAPGTEAAPPQPDRSRGSGR